MCDFNADQVSTVLNFLRMNAEDQEIFFIQKKFLVQQIKSKQNN